MTIGLRHVQAQLSVLVALKQPGHHVAMTFQFKLPVYSQRNVNIVVYQMDQPLVMYLLHLLIVPIRQSACSVTVQ